MFLDNLIEIIAKGIWLAYGKIKLSREFRGNGDTEPIEWFTIFERV